MEQPKLNHDEAKVLAHHHAQKAAQHKEQADQFSSQARLWAAYAHSINGGDPRAIAAEPDALGLLLSAHQADKRGTDAKQKSPPKAGPNASNRRLDG